MSSLRLRMGWIFVGLSLLLHALTVLLFSFQPDRFAAFTVVPIWLWGGIGLLLSSIAFCCLRASLSLIVSAIWAVTLLVGADEARVLANLGKPPLLPGDPQPFREKSVIRVATVNCAHLTFGDPTADIAAWQPDIVLLQQIWPHDARQIAGTLYPGDGESRIHIDNAILTRWTIKPGPSPTTPRSHQATILLPDGRELEIVNLHLATAATNLRLWRRDCWSEHRRNRVLRREELSDVLHLLRQSTPAPDAAVILGGDFNAPATDVVHRLLMPGFTDAFPAAGTGWGNTFQRRVPILRIDHLYSTSRLTPVRCRTVTTRHSDHRFVVADYLIR